MSHTPPDELASPPSPAAPALPTLSVVMPNYNYGAYIGEAIDSALAVDWPQVEVIVVDDGSSDDSWDVISSYGDRIVAVQQPNSGPRVACNNGFARSHGDIVIFLDSDDRLRPTVMQDVVAAWYPGVSKAQYSMERIDGKGRLLHSYLPTYRGRPSPAQVRRWFDETAEYPTPPGSGNAYARGFLEQLFPLGEQCGDATDSAVLAAAPYLGDVVTLTSVQADYRVHGDNRSLLLTPARSKLAIYIDRALQRHRFAMAKAGRDADDLRPLFRGAHLLQLRVAARRLHGAEGALPGDSTARIVRNALGVVTAPSQYSLASRLAIAAWVVAVAVAPRRMAEAMIRRRFVPRHLRT